jgi:hypothetical protein
VIAATSEGFTLTANELQAVASRAGAHDLPTVLALKSCYATLGERDAAFDGALRDMITRGVILDDEVHPELLTMLHVLQRPDREIAVRLVTPDGMGRISVARRGQSCVLARRVADQVDLRIIDDGKDLRVVATAIRSELPRSAPADVEPFGAPLHDMSEALSNTHDPLDLTDRIRALGAPARVAALLGTALGMRQAFAEIVCYALTQDQGTIARGPAALAVMYTKRGRILAAPSASPAGQLWTTLKAGSDHAFGQAIDQLVELSGEQWETRTGSAP